jgi:actin-related protein
MASAIVITGGPSRLPGFTTRVGRELRKLIERSCPDDVTRPDTNLGPSTTERGDEAGFKNESRDGDNGLRSRTELPGNLNLPDGTTTTKATTHHMQTIRTTKMRDLTRTAHTRPYSSLAGLLSHDGQSGMEIVNDRVHGTAPAWDTGLMNWVGGSLAG